MAVPSGQVSPLAASPPSASSGRPEKRMRPWPMSSTRSREKNISREGWWRETMTTRPWAAT